MLAVTVAGAAAAAAAAATSATSMAAAWDGDSFISKLVISVANFVAVAAFAQPHTSKDILDPAVNCLRCKLSVHAL